MRRVFLLLVASIVMSLVFASSAMAQQSQGDPYCQDDEFIATPPDSLGEGGLECFDTQEQADYYAETGELLPSDAEAPSASTEQYTETQKQASSEYEVLPDTGGIPLGAVGAVAGVLIAAGGLFVMRRRT